ncbi:MAG: glycosyltransferase family 2 protein [Bdellovibrionales bacterium]|nr:glycosyltransferase family 2 protein [Bdellovibrionales bacterium]
MKLSAVIITLNEASNIARAIKSVQFADEVIVFDSFSTDGTQQIARDYGAKVIEHEFLGYGKQKNLALEHCQGDWILSLDADEEVSKELKESILKAIESSQHQAYIVSRRTQFCGQWIYHGGWYPDKLLRLFKKEHGEWTEPHVHEELLPKKGTSIDELHGHLNHYSFPSVLSQVHTNLKYAPLGAQALWERRGRPSLFPLVIRPIGKFLECFFLKKGFLDGTRGLIIAINAAYSMFLKYSIAYFNKRGLN